MPTEGMFLCPRCGDIYDIKTAVKHQLDKRPVGIEMTLMMCQDCDKQSDCSSPTGSHSEVWDRDDLKENGDIRRLEQEPKYLSSFGNGQIGTCSICGEWFYWNVDLQRWRDAAELLNQEPEEPERYLDVTIPLGLLSKS